MISKLLNFLSNENIYLLANWGVIPFWLLLITAPRNIITNIFVHSIVPSIFLSAAYVLIAYNIFLNDILSAETSSIPTSPITRNALSVEDLAPNRVLASAIESERASLPTHHPQNAPLNVSNGLILHKQIFFDSSNTLTNMVLY